MAQEVCRILDKSGHDPRDLGSCKVLTGKIQEASGMRLGFGVRDSFQSRDSGFGIRFSFGIRGSGFGSVSGLGVRDSIQIRDSWGSGFV